VFARDFGGVLVLFSCKRTEEDDRFACGVEGVKVQVGLTGDRIGADAGECIDMFMEQWQCRG